MDAGTPTSTCCSLQCSAPPPISFVQETLKPTCGSLNRIILWLTKPCGHLLVAGVAVRSSEVVGEERIDELTLRSPRSFRALLVRAEVERLGDDRLGAENVR